MPDRGHTSSRKAERPDSRRCAARIVTIRSGFSFSKTIHMRTGLPAQGWQIRLEASDWRGGESLRKKGPKETPFVADDAPRLIANLVGFDEIGIESEFFAILLIVSQARETEEREGDVARALAQMLAPSPFAQSYGTYADGWFISSLDGHRYVWHDGDLAGYQTMNATFPNDGLDIIILTNDGSGLDPY